MGIRVTESLCLEIYDKQSIEHNFLPFIIGASQIVDKISEYIILNEKTPDNANLMEIERFLSCHFMTAQEKVTTGEGVGGVSESYSLSTKVGLNSSHYGQMAILLDTSGYLRKLDKGEISTITKTTKSFLVNL